MNKAIFALALIAIVSARHISEDMKPIIEEVNNAKTTWTAGYNERHDGFTMESLKGQCGAWAENVHEKLPKQFALFSEESIPTSFDARTAWPNCESVSEVRDQSACGSCWAFGASEAMSDRLCIASGQKDQTRISSNDLLACCSSCGGGCGGGYPSAAWSYYQNTGLRSGDLYGDTKYCQAYAFPPCAHHTHSSKYPDCPSTEYNTPSCKQECSSASGRSWSTDNNQGSSTYSIQGVSQIQNEIMTNGPVEAAFTVYADFEAYKSGVYQHVSGSYLGGHAIKILGWGVENGVEYWIVANSWNETWGMNGYFYIKRGTDECGIEDSVVAGKAPSSVIKA